MNEPFSYVASAMSFELVAPYTMVSRERMANLDMCIRDVIAQEIPGHFIETGCWKGGTCIYMRLLLDALGNKTKKVYAADSFKGLPSHPEDQYFIVPIDECKANFDKHGYLDDRTVIMEGWFADTLPTVTEHFSIVRLDGDEYWSTMDALRYLYPRLHVGGWLIIDDYNADPGCRQATDEWLRYHPEISYQATVNEGGGIVEGVGIGIFWKKYG